MKNVKLRYFLDGLLHSVLFVYELFGKINQRNVEKLP